MKAARNSIFSIRKKEIFNPSSHFRLVFNNLGSVRKRKDSLPSSQQVEYHIIWMENVTVNIGTDIKLDYVICPDMTLIICEVFQINNLLRVIYIPMKISTESILLLYFPLFYCSITLWVLINWRSNCYTFFELFRGKEDHVIVFIKIQQWI